MAVVFEEDPVTVFVLFPGFVATAIVAELLGALQGMGPLIEIDLHQTIIGIVIHRLISLRVDDLDEIIVCIVVVNGDQIEPGRIDD